jgi:hypothetical protein
MPHGDARSVSGRPTSCYPPPCYGASLALFATVFRVWNVGISDRTSPTEMSNATGVLCGRQGRELLLQNSVGFPLLLRKEFLHEQPFCTAPGSSPAV